MAKKFYAVKTGRTPGVYGTWADCKAQVDGYSGAVYKSFPTAAEALAFVTGETKQVERSGVVAYVDGSYHSGTGEFSYGVVILRDGKELCFQEKLNDPSLAAMHNVAGEIKGAECAMRYAVAEGLSEITIVHDYEGLQNGVWANGKLAKKGHRLIKHFMIVSSPRYM